MDKNKDLIKKLTKDILYIVRNNMKTNKLSNRQIGERIKYLIEKEYENYDFEKDYLI